MKFWPLLVALVLTVQETTSRTVTTTFERVRIPNGQLVRCYDKTLKKYFRDGDVWGNKDCTKTTCDIERCIAVVSLDTSRKYRHEYVIETQSCYFPKKIPANCHRFQPNKYSKFPDCCPKIRCKRRHRGFRLDYPWKEIDEGGRR